MPNTRPPQTAHAAHAGDALPPRATPGGPPPSLLEQDMLAEPAAPRRAPALARLGASVRRAAAGAWQKKAVRVGAAAAAVLALAGGGVAWWLAVRIDPPPDYATANLDVLFDYTLLNDDFNRLSIDERLRLIEQLVTRLRDMGSSDSVLMAMFASQIAGPARAQLEKNLSRLGVDVFDSFAQDYDPNASVADRKKYLAETFVKIESWFEKLGGEEPRDVAPEERLARAQRQAQREAEWAREGNVGASEMARMFDVMNNRVGAHASGFQKRRITGLLRDMSKVMRNQDLASGEVTMLPRKERRKEEPQPDAATAPAPAAAASPAAEPTMPEPSNTEASDTQPKDTDTKDTESKDTETKDTETKAGEPTPAPAGGEPVKKP